MSVTLYLFYLLQFIVVISPDADHIADKKSSGFFGDSLGAVQHGRLVSVVQIPLSPMLLLLAAVAF